MYQRHDLNFSACLINKALDNLTLFFADNYLAGVLIVLDFRLKF